MYLAHRVPDAPTKGDKIRSFHQLRALAARHEVHLFALDDDPQHREVRPAWQDEVAAATVLPLTSLGARLRTLSALVRGHSLSAAHFAVPALGRQVRAALDSGRFDVAVVYSGAMDPLVRGFRPRVLDLVDVDSAKFQAYYEQGRVRGPRRLAFGLEGRRLRRLEQDAVREADLSLVCTEAEARVLRQFADPRRLEVLTNGVDTDAFPFHGREGRRPAEILFVGALDYQANIDCVLRLAQDLLPALRRGRPDVKLCIVGRNPTAEVVQLGEREGVEVVRDAPSVLPYLHRATLSVLPFRIARGIQNKALEAFSAGLPVVMSNLTTQGLTGKSGEHYLAGNGDEELVARSLELLQDADRRDQLAGAARALIEERYAWPRLLQRFVNWVEEVAAARQAG